MNYKYELIHAESKEEFNSIATKETKRAKVALGLLCFFALFSFAAVMTFTTFIVKITYFFEKKSGDDKNFWIDINYLFVALAVLFGISFISSLVYAVRNDLKLKDIRIMQKEYASKSNVDIWVKRITKNREEILMHKKEIERLKSQNEQIKEKIKTEEIKKLVDETMDVVESVEEVAEVAETVKQPVEEPKTASKKEESLETKTEEKPVESEEQLTDEKSDESEENKDSKKKKNK